MNPRSHLTLKCIGLAITFISLFCTRNYADLPKPLQGVHRILFLGDSITYAGGYVAEIQSSIWLLPGGTDIDIINAGLPSETLSGLSEEGHAGGAFPRPDLHERLDRVLGQIKPDLIVSCYGMNDGIYKPFDKSRFAAYQRGYEDLQRAAKAIGAKLWILTPAPYDYLSSHPKSKATNTDDYDVVLAKYSQWLVSKRRSGWNVIDVHTPVAAYRDSRRKVEPNFTFQPDGVHPNSFGHYLIAKPVLRAWDLNRAPETAVGTVTSVTKDMERLRDAYLTRTGHKRPDMHQDMDLDGAIAADKSTRIAVAESAKQFQNSAFPGLVGDYHGYVKHDFYVSGNSVIVVDPKTTAVGKPWIWRAEFFDHRPEADLALLKMGWHLVYVNVGNTFGCPDAMEKWDAFYEFLTLDLGFSKKPALEGLSRGGLYVYNWAASHPDRVSSIYGDAPVCDFKSWPGGKGKGPGSKGDWEKLIRDYHFANEAEALAYPYNPVDNLVPIVKAGIPIIHVAGGADEVVPIDENTYVIRDRLQKLGTKMELIVKPGGLHHPHGLDDPTPVVEFILTAFKRK